jgi:hypothetical protein
MSGGYKDDTDTGGTFWYTGQGGQGKNNVQVRSAAAWCCWLYQSTVSSLHS